MSDSRLFFVTTFLIIISVVMSYSLSAYTIIYYHYSEFHFLARQFIAAGLGVLIMWMIANLDPNAYVNKIGFALLWLFLFFMVIIYFLPESLASSAGGAKRWIRLPFFSLAPSEFFKLGFVFFLAWSFSRKINYDKKAISIAREVALLLPYVVVFLAVALLILMVQNDLGQVVLLALTLIVMLLLAGGSFSIIAGVGAAAFLGGLFFIFTSAHRINRVKSWWAGAQDTILSFLPNDLASKLRYDDLPMPYQVFNASNAMSNGGIFGTGLGFGNVKLGFLSEVHTDFVLAGICEELGLVGIIIISLLYAYMIFRILKIANRVEDKTFSLFCVGVAMLLAFSFVINAFGVVGVIPIKGIAVPFLSYGGSSMIANCIAIGLVLSISRSVRNLN